MCEKNCCMDGLKKFVENRQKMLESELAEAYSMKDSSRILDLESRLSELAMVQYAIIGEV